MRRLVNAWSKIHRRSEGASRLPSDVDEEKDRDLTAAVMSLNFSMNGWNHFFQMSEKSEFSVGEIESISIRIRYKFPANLLVRVRRD